MRTELNHHTISDFRKRFGSLHDSVIYSITFDLFNQPDPYSSIITIKLGAIDHTKTISDRWVHITLIVENITQFILKKARNYQSSILRRVVIGFFDGEVYIDFFPSNTEYHIVDEFNESLDQQKSVLFMVSGKQCYFQE